MKLHLFTFLDLHTQGDCFANFLELRKRVLVDQLGWNLSNDGHHEMDQYDHPLSIYSVVSEGGKVIAGARATPCNANWLGWSYMLLDAHKRKILAIPENLLESYPTDSSTWECTRLVVADDPEFGFDRRLALQLVVHGLCSLASQRGATSLISLSPITFGRLLRGMGYDAQAIGQRYRGEEDGREYQPFQMACNAQVNEKLCSMHIVPPMPAQPSGLEAEAQRLVV